MNGVETPFLTVAPELLLAAVALLVVLLGWRSFSVPSFGVLATLALLPLLKTAAHDGVLARFAAPDVFTFLAFAGTMVLLLRRRDAAWRSIRVPVQALAGLVAFFPCVVLSFLATEDPARSLVETLSYGVNAVLLGLIVFHVRTREDLFACFRAWEAGVVLAVAGSVGGLALLVTGNFDTPLTEGPKLASTFKKSGQLSAYLLPSLPILWFNLRHLSASRRARSARTALIVASFVALLATGSRTGLALGAALVTVLFGAGWARAFLQGRVALRVSVAALCVLAAFPLAARAIEALPFSFHRALSILEGADSLQSLSPTRYYQYQGWLVAAAEFPWTGIGTGDFKTRATSLAPAAWHSHEVHNTYLGVWAETGVLGIAGLAVFYLGVLRAAWQVRTRGDRATADLGLALVVAILALFLYGVSNFGLRMRHLWSVFGLAVAAWNVVVAHGAKTGTAEETAA
ncbi:MAG: O-antigen ligase family protein [Candidatus Eiseniibacteriota bacterium]